MGKPAGDEQEFQCFYRSYPRHKKPQDARRAWHQTTAARPSIEDLLLALDRQKQEWQRRGTDPNYIPYPATWLRAHSWEDEEDEPQLDPVTAHWKRINGLS